MSSSAEALAAQFEHGETDINLGSAGKRTKSEKVDHKHDHPEGDTRKMVNNALNGEKKRKDSGSK